MGAQVNKEFAAAVLIEAIFNSDATACDKYGITVRTLQSYRKRLHEDPELSAIFATKKLLLDKEWAEDTVRAIKQASGFIADAAEAARQDDKCKKDPQMVSAIAGALKMCADVHLTGKVIDARVRNAGAVNTDRTADGLLSEIPPEAPAH